jgi:hypothetical protein
MEYYIGLHLWVMTRAKRRGLLILSKALEVSGAGNTLSQLIDVPRRLRDYAHESPNEGEYSLLNTREGLLRNIRGRDNRQLVAYGSRSDLGFCCRSHLSGTFGEISRKL